MNQKLRHDLRMHSATQEQLKIMRYNNLSAIKLMQEYQLKISVNAIITAYTVK